jgi:hypothetical protein
MGVHAEAIQQLYVAYFGRPADPAGLKYWEDAVVKANGSMAAVADAFAASAEYRDTFAGLNDFGTVDLVYHNLFGRAAERGGLDYWGQALSRHDLAISNAVTTIARGAQGSDKVAVANKVTASIAFTNALDRAEEIISYTGESANAILQKWLAGITTDASLQTALAGLDAFVQELVHGNRPIDQGSGLFETVSVAALPAVYDADSLSTHAQAIEFTASDPFGQRSITNLAASSRLRFTDDLGQSALSVTQKSPGALKITIDSKGWVPAAAGDVVNATVAATNATELNVWFNKYFSDAHNPNDNAVTLNLNGVAATLNVTAQGNLAQNVLNYKDTGAGALHAITVTGTSGLVLNTERTDGLSLIDATQHQGGLSVGMAALKEGGVVKLGAGIDHVTLEAAASPAAAAIKSIQYFHASASTSDTSGDVLMLNSESKVADGNVVIAGGVLGLGVVTFNNAVPASLEAAISMANLAADAKGEVLLFAYQNDSYMFVQGGDSPDAIVRLVGTTGVHGLYETTNNSFIIY